MSQQVRLSLLSQPQLTNLFPDPGLPLDETDFWNARQLRPKRTNETTVNMMRPPQWRNMDELEELELIGEETIKKNAKLALAHVRSGLK